MDFALTEEHRMIQKAVRRFAKWEIASIVGSMIEIKSSTTLLPKMAAPGSLGHLSVYLIV